MSSTTRSVWARIGRLLGGLAALGFIALGAFALWFVHSWTEAFGGRADYTAAYIFLGIGVTIAALLVIAGGNRKGRATLRLTPAPPQPERHRHRIPPSLTAPCPHCERPIDVRRNVCVYCSEQTGWG